HHVPNVFERALVRREECESIAIAALTRSLVLYDVSGGLHRRRIGITAPVACRWRQQEESSLVSILDAEQIVRGALDAQEAVAPVLLLGSEERHNLRVDLCGRVRLRAIVRFLIEGGDRGEPIVLASAVEIGRALAEPSQRLRELSRLLARHSAREANARNLDAFVGRSIGTGRHEQRGSRARYRPVLAERRRARLDL